MIRRLLSPRILALGLLLSLAPASFGQSLEFNRDIRPILSNNCFVCHGPDNNLRKGDLRLDLDSDVYKNRDGHRIIVPGKPLESELYKRLITTEAAERMPPAKTKKTLTAKEIATVKLWIEQGGKYQPHWSFVAAKKFEQPTPRDKSWVRTPIDAFILARLDAEGLKPSPEADRRTLIRRLSFDLTGLPPTPAEVDAFLADNSATAYEKLVDRLLQSPHHGERLAIYWLDLVRYADTGGYHSDNHRDIALFRDYVISAFNSNKPYDRFVHEQLAGDLLPDATNETKIASGFNRLLQTTEEGGAQPKEYTAKYAADRVRNTGTIFLGTTIGCCECHDHKYDPFSTKDFYSFAAFFADVQETAVGRQAQTPIMSLEQQAKVKELEGKLAPLQAQLKTLAAEHAPRQAAWEKQAKEDKKTPKNIAAILALEAAKRNPKQQQELTAYYHTILPDVKAAKEQVAAMEKTKTELTKKLPQTLITTPGAPRMVRMLPRGNWLDDSGPVMAPDVPAFLGSVKPKDAKSRATRLDLAKWVTAPENPLTARVFVNRLWLLYFGQGIVKTADDLGSQGALPSHPELLDWLAVELRESGWNVRHIVKLMVLSNAYRQSSLVRDELQQQDPYNVLLARQARFRLDAELVRDNALAVSGLLVQQIGGPSVKPYQPAGYWRYLNFPVREWANDTGPSQYRRGLYTYWQRSFPQPSLLAFDAPSREECTVQRTRSNTPQQALVLLNDPTYVEAARVLAQQVMKSSPDVDGRLQYLYRQVLARAAQPAELDILRKLHAKHLQEYQKDAKAVDGLLKVGQAPNPPELPAVEVAAWLSVTRVVLNLHETITRN